jgi:hypothetical protein
VGLRSQASLKRLHERFEPNDAISQELERLGDGGEQLTGVGLAQRE